MVSGEHATDYCDVLSCWTRAYLVLQEPPDGLSSTERFYIRSENVDKLCLERANQSCLMHCG